MTARIATCLLAWMVLAIFASGDAAEDLQATPPQVASGEPSDEKNRQGPKGLARLTPEDRCWIDLKRKLVLVEGEICEREHMLEMFACTKGTKEHESVVAVDSKAFVIHTGLLAVGAVPGHPVKFDPEYVPANGTEIDIFVLWTDKEGKRHQVRAQEWVHNKRTGKQLQQSWVFGGSGFWVDEFAGERIYHAEGGELVCVSNFSTAMLDLPIESSQANQGLLFEPITDRIPPRGTKVKLVFIPKQPPAGDQSEESVEKQQDGPD